MTQTNKVCESLGKLSTCSCLCVLMYFASSQDSTVEIAFIPGKGLFPSSTSLHNGIQRAAGNNYNSGRLKVHVRSPEVSYDSDFTLQNNLLPFFPPMSITVAGFYRFISETSCKTFSSYSLFIFLCRSVQRSLPLYHHLLLTSAHQISTSQVDHLTPSYTCTLVVVVVFRPIRSHIIKCNQQK